MAEKRAIDGFGAAALIGFATLLGFNQVVVKLTGGGFGPVFQAGLRSAAAAVLLLGWMALRGRRLDLPREVWGWGVVLGVLFSLEFLCLYIALDLTSVSRASILFYSMPLWLALGVQILLPEERLNGSRLAGLGLAMAGVALALVERDGAQVSLLGDALAILGAIFWAALALLVRVSPLSRVGPETQLLSQLAVSAVILLGLAPFMGDLMRSPNVGHLAGLAFQVLCIATFAYLLWFWLLARYPANTVASFSFLSPVLAVLLGWLILGERIGPQVWVALALVAAGIFLINRR